MHKFFTFHFSLFNFNFCSSNIYVFDSGNSQRSARQAEFHFRFYVGFLHTNRFLRFDCQANEWRDFESSFDDFGPRGRALFVFCLNETKTRKIFSFNVANIGEKIFIFGGQENGMM